MSDLVKSICLLSTGVLLGGLVSVIVVNANFSGVTIRDSPAYSPGCPLGKAIGLPNACSKTHGEMYFVEVEDENGKGEMIIQITRDIKTAFIRDEREPD